MDYSEYVRKLPDGPVPEKLTYEDVVAYALTREHLADDVNGINASLDIIRRTRGGRWPTEPVTEEGNYVDLVWHECEFRDGGSYTYGLYDTSGRYLGCAYLYPMGRRTKLTEDNLKYDVDVSWWVTPTAYEEGFYTKVHRGLVQWLSELHFTAPYYSNREIPD
jgi:hypothetical protein